MKDVKITDVKLVYPEFKEFKNIYTSVNSASEVVLIGNKEKGIDLVFSRDDACYIFYGHWNVDTALAKWLREYNKVIAMKMETFKLLNLTLKKDVISYEYNDIHFKFTFKVKGTDEVRDIFLFDCRGSSTIDTIVKNINSKRDLLKYSFNLENKLFEDELLTLFLDSKATVTEERTNDKLIEIPVGRLVCYLKNGKASIKYSDKIGGQRFVEITSEDDELGLRLRQLFLTI